jgi:hypothetical protein
MADQQRKRATITGWVKRGVVANREKTDFIASAIQPELESVKPEKQRHVTAYIICDTVISNKSFACG